MSAEARIYELQRDSNDREAWNLVAAKPGHWNPYTALRHFLEDEEPEAGTYRCESGGSTATVGWTGERLAA